MDPRGLAGGLAGRWDNSAGLSRDKKPLPACRYGSLELRQSRRVPSLVTRKVTFPLRP